MQKSFLCIDHQPLLVRFLLLFCRQHVEPGPKGWLYAVKTLRGVDYLVRVFHVNDLPRLISRVR